jgi:2-iminobutanoate/2-iminopropanoate deaminase
MTSLPNRLIPVATEAAPAAIGPYSQGVIVPPWLFLSGQIPLDPVTGELVGGDIEQQALQILRNLDAVLTAAGSHRQHVVKVTLYLTDLADFARVNPVYGKFFSAPYPARSTVQVVALPKGATIEMDAIAWCGDSPPRGVPPC